MGGWDRVIEWIDLMERWDGWIGWVDRMGGRGWQVGGLDGWMG